ncbi:deoxyribonuclease [Clostridia bacterium]|nr:deoxyribonuclease [Clostridia bacterium]
MEYIDTHTHYDDKVYDSDRDALFAQMREAGVSRVINVGSDISSNAQTLALADKYPFVYAAVGVHPTGTRELTHESFEDIKNLRHEKIVAIGEIGLDYHYEDTDRDAQIHWFRVQLRLAKDRKLPVIIHAREAGEDCYSILREELAYENGGVIHCFSEDLEHAKRYIDLGFHIGIGGVVTFKKADVLAEVAKNIPLSRLLTETDCPYLAPAPYRGKRNNSAHLSYIAEKIAELRGIDVSEFLDAVNNNAKTLFSLK